MEALFREAVEKILPFTESKKLQKIPKLQVRLGKHLPGLGEHRITQIFY